jgi:mannose/fructose/sorbose-specific phosphotransferase system IIA component
MIGILVISHGNLSKGLLSSLSMFYAEEKQIEALSVNCDTNIDSFTKEMGEAIARLDKGEGVIVLADMFGGSPCNSTFGYIGKNVDVIAGVNFPMLLSAVTYRHTTEDRKTLVDKLIESSKAGIIHVNKKLEGIL